jgi:hypothetical protein
MICLDHHILNNDECKWPVIDQLPIAFLLIHCFMMSILSVGFIVINSRIGLKYLPEMKRYLLIKYKETRASYSPDFGQSAVMSQQIIG